MAPRDRARIAFAAIVLLAAQSVTSLFAAAPKMSHPYPDQLAAGAGHAIGETKCLMCHSATLITQQAKDSAGWARTIGTMKTWGAPLDSAETDTLLHWLVATYGPRPRATPADPGTK
jgi:mono/diheme cytochrome c family protein